MKLIKDIAAVIFQCSLYIALKLSNMKFLIAI